MSFEFKLPELGEQIESGDVVRILVAEGDRIEQDQIVLELETDKAVLEVPSPKAGVISKIHVNVGDEVPVGGLILTLDTTAPDEQAESSAGESEATSSPSEPEADPGESTINEYPPLEKDEKAPTQEESESQPASESKASQAPESESTREDEPKPSSPPTTSTKPNASSAAHVTASPSVRRLAREIGVDLTTVQGSGDGGRISEGDVKAAARNRQASSDQAAQPASRSTSGSSASTSSTIEPLDDAQFTKWGEIRRETMSRVRKTTAKNLAQAWSTIPHVTHFDDADITDIDQQRKKLAKEVEEAGGQLTVTAIVLKIVGLALREFPMFRASIDVAEQEIVYKDYIHIGVAVDTDRGLLVPVLRDVDQKSLSDIAVELNQLSAAARTAKLSLEDMQGAVFSVSNLGGIGGTNFTPIINPPEVAIMGVSRGRMQPVFMHGTFVPRLIMPFSVSYDHRLIDGADAARFCRWIATTIESPLRILLKND